MTTNKQELIKPRLLEAIDRLRRFVELDNVAPACVIGQAAYSVFATTLAVYGANAGGALIDAIRDRNLQNRGVCSEGDCTSHVERPSCGVCPECLDRLDIGDDEVEA